jgi:hypothetical protein
MLRKARDKLKKVIRAYLQGMTDIKPKSQRKAKKSNERHTRNQRLSISSSRLLSLDHRIDEYIGTAEIRTIGLG